MSEASPWQRALSVRHGFSFWLSRKLQSSRGEYRETACHRLTDLPAAESEKIRQLQQRWGVDFATTQSPNTARNNYAYLGLLTDAYRAWALEAPPTDIVADVGCANFWYAAALRAFFRPQRLVGVELDGYRRYRDGHCRYDYATGYLRDVPGGEFRVADYTGLKLPADVITCWFPFVTPGPLLAWRLPLSRLQPLALFRQVASNLQPGGSFVMVNRRGEAALAANLAESAGLVNLQRFAGELVLVQETLAVTVSRWTPPA